MLDTVADQADFRSAAGREELAQALLTRADTGLVALDADWHIVLVNPVAQDLLEVRGPVIGQTFDAALRGSTLPRAAVTLVEQWMQAAAERPLLLPLDAETTLSIVSSAGPAGHRLLMLKQQDRAVIEVRRKDVLTGLSDRTWFNEQLAGLLAAPDATPALLMIDLDRFKAVNDSLGRPVGDALLRLVAKRLTAALRDADVICRLTGDVFAVLMKRPNQPQLVGRRLVAMLSRPYLIEGAKVSVGASIGLALAPDHGSTPATLIHAADVALYAAKQDGRGSARVFDAALDATTRHRQRVLDELRKAIRLGQFALHFQPQLILESGALTGFEALLRWDHPEMGALLPGDFLAVAEDSGLAWPIGEWVLQQACEQAMSWPSHLSVAVNVSARQLMDRQRLPRIIRNVLLRTGLAPHRLEIEVTEKALAQLAEPLAVLTSLHALGVGVTLDNFGTGCLSIATLQRYGLHKLKIDHSFIHALGRSDAATSVVRAIAALGDALGIVTVAERVETADQADRLRSNGCTRVQGHLVGKPVPASEVGQIIDALQASPRPSMHVRSSQRETG